MTLESITFSGEFPVGIHWSPGEIRTIPSDWPGQDATLPPGLVRVPPDPAPAIITPKPPRSASP